MRDGVHNASLTTHNQLTLCELWDRKWRETNQFIYVATDGQRVKVGSSATPEARVATLRREGRRPGLRLVHIIPLGVLRRQSAHILENHIHDQLGRPHRWAGEWYDLPLDRVIATANRCAKHLLRVWKRNAAEILALHGRLP